MPVAVMYQPQQNTVEDGHLVNNTSSNATGAPATFTSMTPTQNNPVNGLVTNTKCARDVCNRFAVKNEEWEDAYCSNECVVMHCREVFNSWVQQRKVR